MSNSKTSNPKMRCVLPGVALLGLPGLPLTDQRHHLEISLEHHSPSIQGGLLLAFLASRPHS